MSSGDLESRVAALEGQVRDLSKRVQASEADAAAARVLAGAADRDVEEIRGEIRDFRRATLSGLNALRADQLDLRREVGHLGEGFAEIQSRLDVAAAGQQQIALLLQTLIRRPGEG